MSDAKSQLDKKPNCLCLFSFTLLNSMSDTKYLKDTIGAIRHIRTGSGQFKDMGVCIDGYTYKRGAPTCYEIMLDGRQIWRRVYVWCFSNSGTYFIRVKGQCYIIRPHEIEYALSTVPMEV